MSSKQLPPKPNLRNLKNQAKQLLKAYQAGVPAAAERVAASSALSTAPPPADFTLQDAQRVLAYEHGFSRWQDIVAAVKEAEAPIAPIDISAAIPFTPEEMKAALNYMGVHVERFQYDGSEPHDIGFCLEHYVGGKKQDRQEAKLDNNPAGENSLVLFMRHKENDTLNFALQRGGHRHGLSDIPVEGRNARAWDRLVHGPIPLGEAVPIFWAAAQKDSIKTQSEKSVEELVATYDMVVIVSVEIRPSNVG